MPGGLESRSPGNENEAGEQALPGFFVNGGREEVYQAMTIRLCLAWCAGLVLASIGAAAAAGDVYDLRLGYHEGDMARYQITATGSIKATLPGMGDIDMPFSMGVIFSQAVTKVSRRGNYVIDARFEKMVMHMMGQKVDMPTSQLPDLQMLISPKGKILDARGFEALNAGGASAGGFGTMMGSIGPGYAVFPDKPVPVGYTWSTDLGPILSMFGEMAANAHVKNAFAAIENVDGQPCARIDSTAHLPLSLTGAQLGLPENGNLDLVADFHISAWYPIDAPRLTKSTGGIVMSGSGDVPGPDGKRQHIEFKMNIQMGIDEIAFVSGTG
jgi:hypothetical protein